MEPKFKIGDTVQVTLRFVVVDRKDTIYGMRYILEDSDRRDHVYYEPVIRKVDDASE